MGFAGNPTVVQHKYVNQCHNISRREREKNKSMSVKAKGCVIGANTFMIMLLMKLAKQ